ncbi:hypothetical protein [Hyalangium rubrum]|uniref:Pentapeptide repeat-containing protein n=1 Tax=Hyalangium rubrum TaxID=3103134 RepID=A0ABU5GZ34_9BACT|nr:hypothetical protein [Hyalangium sp. s54d21]MDY7226410.1 hypothetical protein [Hyalangium sp. s54d21]
MIQFRDREISNERLVLDSKTELYYLGHDLTLRNCTLVVKVPARALVIARTHLIDCTIEVSRVLKNFRWGSAHLKGCRFTGRFSGNDFGTWPDMPEEGSIENCDFSGAQLDACRFLGCDTRTLRFPPWPCFTLLEPARRWRELAALPWPGKIGHIVMEGFADDPPSTQATTYSATELAKSYGTTPDAIKAVIEKLDGVRY